MSVNVFVIRWINRYLKFSGGALSLFTGLFGTLLLLHVVYSWLSSLPIPCGTQQCFSFCQATPPTIILPSIHTSQSFRWLAVFPTFSCQSSLTLTEYIKIYSVRVKFAKSSFLMCPGNSSFLILSISDVLVTIFPLLFLTQYFC